MSGTEISYNPNYATDANATSDVNVTSDATVTTSNAGVATKKDRENFRSDASNKANAAHNDAYNSIASQGDDINALVTSAAFGGTGNLSDEQIESIAHDALLLSDADIQKLQSEGKLNADGAELLKALRGAYASDALQSGGSDYSNFVENFERLNDTQKKDVLEAYEDIDVTIHAHGDWNETANHKISKYHKNIDVTTEHSAESNEGIRATLFLAKSDPATADMSRLSDAMTMSGGSYDAFVAGSANAKTTETQFDLMAGYDLAGCSQSVYDNLAKIMADYATPAVATAPSPQVEPAQQAGATQQTGDTGDVDPNVVQLTAAAAQGNDIPPGKAKNVNMAMFSTLLEIAQSLEDALMEYTNEAEKRNNRLKDDTAAKTALSNATGDDGSGNISNATFVNHNGDTVKLTDWLAQQDPPYDYGDGNLSKEKMQDLSEYLDNKQQTDKSDVSIEMQKVSSYEQALNSDLDQAAKALDLASSNVKVGIDDMHTPR